MKKLLTILFLLLSVDTFCQSVNWTVGNEAIVTNYVIQSSPDTLIWADIGTVAKGKSEYVFTIPLTQAYIRIKAKGLVDFFTPSILFTPSLLYRSTITTPVFKTSGLNDNLTWKTTESNVNYYLIQKSTDAKWSTKVSAKGSTSYKTTVFRIFSKKPVYRITPVFANSTTGTTINFK